MTQSSRVYSALLKYWRNRQGWSQLDLAVNAGVSSKHVSFLETGRAQPSEEMIMLLGATLNVPLRVRNQMLRAVGFEPIFEEPSFASWEGTSLGRTMALMLQKHEPFPMVVMNAQYDILMANQMATTIYEHLTSTSPVQTNAVEALADPEKIRPHVVNWEETMRAMLSRVYCESLHSERQQPLKSLMSRVLSYPGIPESWRLPDFSQTHSPTFTITFQVQQMQLSFLTTLTQFSAPQNITLDELQIESYYPLDDTTQTACEMLVG